MTNNADTGTVQSKGSLVQFKGNKYRWVYELPMLKSFFLLFEVWKVLFIGSAVVYVLLLIINVAEGKGLGSIVSASAPVLIPLGILLALSIPAYYIVTKANNGKYTVLFEMDDSGIDHIQIKTDKALALEKLTMLAGAVSGNSSAMGSGALSASGTSLYSRFSKVKRIRAVPEKHLITLDGTLVKNQVYVDDADFDFVYDFIVKHCPNADT